MVSALGFSTHRARPGSTDSNRRKHAERHPSLHLHDSFMKENARVGSEVEAMQISASTHADKRLETVPVKMRMEVSPQGLRSISPEPSQSPDFLEIIKPRDSLAKSHTEAIIQSLERTSENGSNSVQASRSFHQLSNHDSESDLDISPISDDYAPARSTSVLARFFPELSSNLHAISPTIPVPADQNMRSLNYASIFENEHANRLSTLYADSFEITVDEGTKQVGQNCSESGKSRYSGQVNVRDNASSCYSHRTSLASINTHYPDEKPRYEPADSYSAIDPVSAGVFDDNASMYSRAPSVALPAASGSESRSASSTRPPRTGRLAPYMSMEELKNKPLPLEPVREPSPLAIRRHSQSWNVLPQSNSQCSLTSQRPIRGNPMTVRRQQYETLCHECGNHGMNWPLLETGAIKRGPLHGQQMRRRPTMSQAAEELEFALADLTKGSTNQQRTVLVLDGPLQVSRHNGDLVATRPAPRPPPIAPHSQSHPDGPLEFLRSAKGKTRWPGKSPRVENTSKEHQPHNLRCISGIPTTEKIAKATKPKPSSTKKSTKASKASDNLKRHGQPVSKPSGEGLEKPRLKKSFTLSMPSISRKISNTFPKDRKQDQDFSIHSWSSQNSLDPPSNRECHSPHQASSSSLASSKRDELLLQLPRLQTQDLKTNSPLDSRTRDQEQGRTHPAGLGSANITGGFMLHPLLCVLPPAEEKILIRSRMRNTGAFMSTAQASSVHIPPEQIYELDATPPSPSARPELVRKNKHVSIDMNFPADMPKSLVIAIMERIESLDDLFNFALVNKHVHSIFKGSELYLIKNALFNMSPPAWELREMSPPWEDEWTPLRNPDSRAPEYTPATYLDRYATDIRTLARLKAMILVRCSPFLRRDTIEGLTGADSTRLEEVDDAFWRIWTFCRIFGNGKGRENDLEGQLDWMKGGAKARNYVGATSTMTEPFAMNNFLFEPPEGFARGNCGGLSQKQMYDMIEIWTCLGVLLQDRHSKVTDARAVGILDGLNVAEGDTVQEQSTIEEWTCYILTLGLSAVLTLSSLCPAEATVKTFQIAKSLGLTKWELAENEASRSSFLKEAVSRAYEEQERALSTTSNSPRDLTSCGLDLANDEAERMREQRKRAFKTELRALRLGNVQSNNELASSFSDERPMSEYSAIVRNLDGKIRHPSVSNPEDVPPVPPVPPLVLDRSSTSTSSTTPPTPSYIHPPSNTSHLIYPQFLNAPPHQAFPSPPRRPQVRDPVDRAMSRMIHDLGFNEDDVKWALKITDTGEGIDPLAAEHLLKKEQWKQRHKPSASHGKNGLLHSVMTRQGSPGSGWRWA